MGMREGTCYQWWRSGIAFPNLDPFGIVVIISQQMFTGGSIELLDCTYVPTVVDWPENADLFADHTIRAKSVIHVVVEDS